MGRPSFRGQQTLLVHLGVVNKLLWELFRRLFGVVFGPLLPSPGICLSATWLTCEE